MGNQTSLPKDELENLQERTYCKWLDFGNWINFWLVTLPELESLLKFGGFSKEKPKLSPEEVNRLLARVFGFSFSKFDEIQNGPFIKVNFFGKWNSEELVLEFVYFVWFKWRWIGGCNGICVGDVRFSPGTRWREAASYFLFFFVLNADLFVEVMFKLIDRDHKGKISKQEFTQVGINEE